MNPILKNFLEVQNEEGRALADASDILELRPIPIGDGPAQHFIARFFCKTFVLAPDGQVVTTDHADVGIRFSDDYLKEARGYETVTWLAPASVFHANIRFPAACLGEAFIKPGTTLTEILFQLHAIISWQKWAAHMPLNEAAAQWARSHQDLFPSDPRPLKRRTLKLDVTLTAAGKGDA